MNDSAPATLAELLIVACAEAWRGDGEVLATGIGTIPRLAAALAKLTHTPELMLTDGEAYLVEDPAPLGERASGFAGYMPYARVFDVLWRGRRHAMVTPVQVDRWGQSNISVIGDFARPKVAMLGVRGFPGNSINHANTMFLPNHNPRVLVDGEVDLVGSVGFNPARWPQGVKRDFVDLRGIITNLCVMDFAGPDHAPRVTALHPGVTLDEVRAATGFELQTAETLATTPLPTPEQLAIIRRLDPHGLRAQVIKDDPPALREAA